MIRFTKVPFVHNLSHNLALTEVSYTGMSPCDLGKCVKQEAKHTNVCRAARLRPRKKVDGVEYESCSGKMNLVRAEATDHYRTIDPSPPPTPASRQHPLCSSDCSLIFHSLDSRKNRRDSGGISST